MTTSGVSGDFDTHHDPAAVMPAHYTPAGVSSPRHADNTRMNWPWSPTARPPPANGHATSGLTKWLKSGSTLGYIAPHKKSWTGTTTANNPP